MRNGESSGEREKGSKKEKREERRKGGVRKKLPPVTRCSFNAAQTEADDCGIRLVVEFRYHSLSLL